MKKLKKTGEYSIFQKRSGRYAVRAKNKQWIRGEDKTKLLLAEGLIQVPEPKPTAPPEEAPGAAEAQTESDDAPVEKASAETQAEEASQEAEPADTPEETPAS